MSDGAALVTGATRGIGRRAVAAAVLPDDGPSGALLCDGSPIPGRRPAVVSGDESAWDAW